MSLLVVGSVAFDAIESPYGKVDRIIGGAATYFAVAASFFTPVNLVGIVGDDFTEKDGAIFRGRKKTSGIWVFDPAYAAGQFRIRTGFPLTVPLGTLPANEPQDRGLVFSFQTKLRFFMVAQTVYP